ncbi:hypothetical protein VKT23_011464 [Stygiomarasmius scandens]|uniref:Uncharacterized protein n=1 Tax=Marasmiellus scandens TaxID=2682957 RepID=A0ABR1J988_9AGAR
MPGAQALPLEYDPAEQCRYQRSYGGPSPYRINPLSHCWGGEQLDVGPEIQCPNKPTSRISNRTWIIIEFAIVICIILFGAWYDSGFIPRFFSRLFCCGRRRSAIQLPSDNDSTDAEIDGQPQSSAAVRPYRWLALIVGRFSRNRRQGSISLPSDPEDVQQNGA